MRRYCFALDLKDDEQLIQQYEEHHQHVWDEVIHNIRLAGIFSLDIYRTGNRLFMIMEVADDFTFERKDEIDKTNETVQKWEELMWTFQQALPWASKGEKWVRMSPLFHLPTIGKE